jgi:hypothetical protein
MSQPDGPKDLPVKHDIVRGENRLPHSKPTHCQQLVELSGFYRLWISDLFKHSGFKNILHAN